MEIYNQWLQSCLQSGIPAITTDTAARLMAVLYEYGNNEGFTLSQKFIADMHYIQERFCLMGGMTPEPQFHTLIKKYISELQEYQELHKNEQKDESYLYRRLAPDWAPQLLKERYNIGFIG